MSLKGPLNIVDSPYHLPFIDYAPNLGPRTYVLFDSGDAPFSRYLNSVIFAVSSTALTVTLSSLAVYGLTRFHHKMTWVAIALRLVAVGFLGSSFLAVTLEIRLIFGTATVLALLLATRFVLPKCSRESNRPVPRRKNGPDFRLPSSSWSQR